MKRLLPLLLLCLALTGTAHAWWNDKWTVRKKITIDTTATGGAITDPIGTTPVLIRLSDFNFSARRRTTAATSALWRTTTRPRCLITSRKYDSLLGEAFVWVSVPNLKPGAATTLYLYYGNTGRHDGRKATATPSRPTTPTRCSFIISRRSPARRAADATSQRQQRA